MSFQLGVALYDFQGREEDELSIFKGDQFSIIEKYDDGWWLVDCNAQQGLIPSNYVQELERTDEPAMSERDEENNLNEPIPSISPVKQKSFSPGKGSDITRMQGEREQTTAKIDAIRTVVTNYETGKMNQSMDKKNDIVRTTSVDDEIATTSSSPIRKPKFIRALSEKKMKPIPQVQLDPTSIDYISKLINEKITRELTARDKRLLDQVQDIVSQTLSQMKREELPPPRRSNAGPSLQGNDNPAYESDYDNKSISSAPIHGKNPSKIPRIKLPKINSNDGKPGSSRNNNRLLGEFNNGIGAGAGGMSLPPVKARATLEKNRPVKEEQLSMEGIQYPQCRSVVYPSVNDIDLLKTRHLRKSPKLVLRHIFGYDGDISRHGGSTRGKNITWLSETEIAFPAAAVVVLMDIITEKQRFFINHTDDVVSLTSYAPLSLIASSQIGSDGAILVWNYKEINSPAETSPCCQVIPPPGIRGMSNLSFSPDGKLLLACGIEDSKIVYLFDWQRNQLLTSVKTGHSESCQFSFNPFCFQSFEEEPRQSSHLGKKLNSNNMNSNNNNGLGGEEPRLAGCYTITSYSSKILKFWTLKQIIGLPAQPTKGGRLDHHHHHLRNKKQASNVQYLLEGSQGSVGVKKMSSSGGYSSVCTIGYDDKVNYLLVGLTNGAIQVWKHLSEIIDGRITWAARGKLVLVIADVHDQAITEMDYNIQEGRLITSDSNGVLNVWNVNISARITDTAPLEHLGAIQLDGCTARSLTWNPIGSAIAIGASNNSISVLKVNTLDATGMTTEFDLQALLTAHNGKVRKLAVHPYQDNYFATICSDSTIRIWDSDIKTHISCIYIETPATAISFSNDGNQLAIGNEKGELIILASREFEQLLGRSSHQKMDAERYPDPAITFDWKLVDSKIISSNANAEKKTKKKSEITEIKYSPLEEIIAVGLKDGSIHLLSIKNGYRHVAVCRGHTSQIKNIDFSLDGKVLKSSDGARELLFWDVTTGQQLTNSNYYREAPWNTFSCIYGWGLQGIFNRYDGDKAIAPDSEINCVARSPDGLILACAGSQTVVKIFQYPVISDAIPSGLFGGHTSPVLDVAFCGPDEFLTLISAGGNDSCIFVWDVVYDS